MDFFELLKKRRACHHFKPDCIIPDEDLKEMIEHTRLTPSGYNAQPWEFVVIRKPENIEKVGEIAFKQPHVKDASAIIVVLGDMEIGRNVDRILYDWIRLGYCTEEERPAYHNSIAKKRSPEKRKQMALRNAMLAAMTLLYSAENMGYATCPIMGFSQWQLEEFLQIPEDRCIALMIAIGHAHSGKENPQLPRKTVDEMLHWEQFNPKE